MGITPWQLRNQLYSSPVHHACQFRFALTQTLNPAQNTFLLKLYQAIEKLLQLPPSTSLVKIKDYSDITETKLTQIKLNFTHRALTPSVIEHNPVLIIDLPDVVFCEKSPAIKSTLWNLLKTNLK